MRVFFSDADIQLRDDTGGCPTGRPLSYFNSAQDLGHGHSQDGPLPIVPPLTAKASAPRRSTS